MNINYLIFLLHRFLAISKATLLKMYYEKISNKSINENNFLLVPLIMQPEKIFYLYLYIIIY